MDSVLWGWWQFKAALLTMIPAPRMTQSEPRLCTPCTLVGMHVQSCGYSVPGAIVTPVVLTPFTLIYWSESEWVLCERKNFSTLIWLNQETTGLLAILLAYWIRLKLHCCCLKIEEDFHTTIRPLRQASPRLSLLEKVCILLCGFILSSLHRLQEISASHATAFKGIHFKDLVSVWTPVWPQGHPNVTPDPLVPVSPGLGSQVCANLPIWPLPSWRLVNW